MTPPFDPDLFLRNQDRLQLLPPDYSPFQRLRGGKSGVVTVS